MNCRKISVGALALLVLVSCGKKEEDQTEAVKAYPMTKVVYGQAELQNVYPVTIKGQDDAEIRPRVDGTIEAVYVQEGSIVRKGQALFKLNSPGTEQELQTAQASIVSAEAGLRTAELNVEKTKPLADKGIVSEYQLRTVENVKASAQAQLRQARAALQTAQAKAGWANVISPIDGVVGAIPFLVGSYVSNANAITTVANTKNVNAYFSLNEKDLLEFLRNAEGTTQAEKIKNLPPVSLILADGSSYSQEGRIEGISGVVNGTTGSASLRAVFPNADGLLKSGSSGRLIIPTHKDKVFVIPQKATLQQQNKILVYKVQGDSVVQQIISTLPMPNGKDYVVTEGLKEGDVIVTDGIGTLTNGKKVKAE